MSPEGLEETENDLVKNIMKNQTKTNSNYHFGTTESIYSLGFGPKYYVDPKTNLSVGRFAMKKKRICQMK